MRSPSTLLPAAILAAAVLIAATALLAPHPAGAQGAPAPLSEAATILAARAGKSVDIYLHDGLLIVVGKDKANDVRKDGAFGGKPIRVQILAPKRGLAAFQSTITQTTIRIPTDRVVFWEKS